MSKFDFQIMNTDGKARTGQIGTAHGNIRTPAFMPVGTAGTVKAITPEDVAAAGADVVLGNTYHLMLRPGAEQISSLGGLHRFMNWNRPILTDSGGFQVMSLAKLRNLTEDGVTFQSHLDGSSHHLSPERSVEIQRLVGSDITMVLDECPKHGQPKSNIASSMRLSLRWAERSKKSFVNKPGHGIFGIVQGNIFEDLREESAIELKKIGFDGYAIGGLAVGEEQKQMLMTLDFTIPNLPQDKPRYLMGVGTPSDIIESVQRGIDMFDCVLPTRSGRTGKGFSQRGEINIRNARHANDPRQLDETCGCPVCLNYSRAYLHHLFKANEILGPMLLTRHNLTYYLDLMVTIRKSISKNTLSTFITDFYRNLSKGDIEPY